MSFSGKVVLITGAQEGIGRSMAIAFAEKGAHIAINWLDNRYKAEQVTAITRTLGVQTELIQGDVSKVNDARRIVNKVFETFGSIDISPIVVYLLLWFLEFIN